jgi:hypothetical protein
MELIDRMAGAPCYAFHGVFFERCSLSIVYESHGRKSWDPTIDPAKTVRWLTILAPLYCGEHDEGKGHIIIEKDLRKRTPGLTFSHDTARKRSTMPSRSTMDLKLPSTTWVSFSD